MLLSGRFAAVKRLQSAANNNPPIKFGESGEPVYILQLALLSLNFKMAVSTQNYSRLPDGIFGQETFNAVKGFQAQYNLRPDGIVGKATLSKMDQLFSASVNNLPLACGNCYDRYGPYSPPHLIQAAFDSSGGSEGSARLPTTLPRFLTQPEIAKAQAVFGNSLDFSSILVSDALGINGRAFVSVIPRLDDTSGGTQMTLVNWGPSPSSGRFFHELTHVWQSQHHFAPAAFMANALISQGIAKLFDGSPYAFIPGRVFARYGAEQIAQQVQRSKSDIINHIRAFPRAFLTQRTSLFLGCLSGKLQEVLASRPNLDSAGVVKWARADGALIQIRFGR